MGQKAADAMNPCAVLGAAFARGCAPEGAAPFEFDARGRHSENSAAAQRSRRGVLKAITQMLSSSLQEKEH
jgi:hypothetical protein